MSNMTNSGSGILELMDRLEKLEKRYLGKLEVINFELPANKNRKIMERWAPFTQMLFMQGTTGSATGTYVLSGYGSGTALRYHVGNIITSEYVTIEISGEEYEQEFIINNQSQANLECTLMIIQGDIPTIN
ncbi:MAG: hypothetical protein HFI33_13470 [Lachnospiraceae bacterium]|nr:hypothetical protein [Lachnospiraceae bacterium]